MDLILQCQTTLNRFTPESELGHDL